MQFFSSDEIERLLETANNVRIFFFENCRGNYNIYLFPNDATTDTLSHYKDIYGWLTKGKEVTEYSLTEAPKETLQRYSANELPLWSTIVDLIATVPVTNAPILTPQFISNKIKFIVTEVTLTDAEEEKKVYLVQRFNFKKAVYDKKMRYNILGSRFKKMADSTLSFGECIDCFFWENNVYIINETAFNSLFDFHKRVKEEVLNNIPDIATWDFFDSNDKIEGLIVDKPRKGRQFNKVVKSQNLIVWKRKTVDERKAIIENNEKLKDKFQFDTNNKIVFTKEALNEFFKLLCDDYFKQIISGETAER